jgi:TonB family protein
LAVPLSLVPAVPAAKLQIPRLDTPPPRPPAPSPRPQAANASKQTLVLPNYVVPAAVALLVIVAIIVLPKILGHRPDSSSSASTASAPSAAPPKLADQPVRHELPPGAKPSPTKPAQSSLKTAAEKNPAPPQSSPVKTTPAAAPTEAIPSANAPSASPKPPSVSASSSSASSARGEVLDQVLPDASEKALATIHGVVRVTVRVQVDPTGNVSEATLDSPGPSPYFADLALKAARRWQFTSPEAAGHSVPSAWLIRFHFTPSGSKAFPTQTAP